MVLSTGVTTSELNFNNPTKKLQGTEQHKESTIIASISPKIFMALSIIAGLGASYFLTQNMRSSNPFDPPQLNPASTPNGGVLTQYDGYKSSYTHMPLDDLNSCMLPEMPFNYVKPTLWERGKFSSLVDNSSGIPSFPDFKPLIDDDLNQYNSLDFSEQYPIKMSLGLGGAITLLFGGVILCKTQMQKTTVNRQKTHVEPPSSPRKSLESTCPPSLQSVASTSDLLSMTSNSPKPPTSDQTRSPSPLDPHLQGIINELFSEHSNSPLLTELLTGAFPSSEAMPQAPAPLSQKPIKAPLAIHTFVSQNTIGLCPTPSPSPTLSFLLGSPSPRTPQLDTLLESPKSLRSPSPILVPRELPTSLPEDIRGFYLLLISEEGKNHIQRGAEIYVQYFDQLDGDTRKDWYNLLLTKQMETSIFESEAKKLLAAFFDKAREKHWTPATRTHADVKPAETQENAPSDMRTNIQSDQPEKSPKRIRRTPSRVGSPLLVAITSTALTTLRPQL